MTRPDGEKCHGFPTLEAMEELIEMGQEEGMIAAIGQIEDILAGDATSG